MPYADFRNPQSLNLYAYVNNNPLSFRDADGHGWWSDLWNGLADSTYRPLATMVQHPIVTARNLGSAVTHPIATANAIKNGVVTTTFSALQGNGVAIGTAIGTVGMAFIPGAGEAGEGAEAAAGLGKVGEAAETAKGLGNVAGGAATAETALYPGREVSWVRVQGNRPRCLSFSRQHSPIQDDDI